MRHPLTWSAVVIGLLSASPVTAAPTATFFGTDRDASPPAGGWMRSLTFARSEALALPRLDLVQTTNGQSARPVVFEYSEGYQTRLKIHKMASLATIPLFVAEGVVGQQLYNDPTPGKRTAHLWIATGIGVLFGVNTVTGIWNLTESRKDPNGRARRLTHSILMLAADAGFFATAVSGPGHHMRNPSEYDSQRGVHRALAFTSITLASAGYGIMFVWPH